jgi:hypothetical protein
LLESQVGVRSDHDQEQGSGPGPERSRASLAWPQAELRRLQQPVEVQVPSVDRERQHSRVLYALAVGRLSPVIEAGDGAQRHCHGYRIVREVDLSRMRMKQTSRGVYDSVARDDPDAWRLSRQLPQRVSGRHREIETWRCVRGAGDRSGVSEALGRDRDLVYRGVQGSSPLLKPNG